MMYANTYLAKLQKTFWGLHCLGGKISRSKLLFQGPGRRSELQNMPIPWIFLWEKAPPDSNSEWSVEYGNFVEPEMVVVPMHLGDL